jgi:hypothetical protein
MNNESITSDPSPTSDYFDVLGISGASVEKFLDDRNRYDTGKHVCICGHAVNKHTIFDQDRISCHTARHYCPCREVLAVFYANDTRYFMRKTYGPGSKHALSAGLERLQSVGKTGHWLYQPRCWNQGCPNPQVAVYPVAINKRNQIAYEPAAINVFLCETCFVDILGKPNQVGMGHIW